MIGQTVNQYKILERIGAGGMGVVYRAEDTRLGRIVALKFLPPYALDSEEDRMRFLIEAQSAAALDHPNICTIHEIGDMGEHQFIVMAYVAGPSLKERLKDGALDPAEAVNIAMQISSGLSKAHEKGIIHRDIKPANILLADAGLVKICDFGLAKSSISKKVTRTGSTIGTAAYMSPEQARSELVDQRTDVWSLGVILYEMLAGKPPFVADHEAVVIYAILNDDYPSLEEKRPGLPPALYQIVKKSLAHKAADRYANMEEMRKDLKAVASQVKAPSTISGTYPVIQPSTPPTSKAAPVDEVKTSTYQIPPAQQPPAEPAPKAVPKSKEKKKSSVALYSIVGVLTLAAALLVFWFNRQPSVEGPSDDIIAVEPPAIAPPQAAGDAETAAKTQTQGATEVRMPVVAALYLENASRNREDDYLAAGLTQDLIGVLSGIKNARVLSRYDVLPVRNLQFAADEFGKRLGADYLLEGAIQRDKKLFKLTAHFHRVNDRELVWSFRADRSMNDLISVQLELADSVARVLGVTLTPDERRSLVAVGTTNAEAYENYLKGRYAFERRTEDENEAAEKSFRRALSLDKEYTSAKVGLARTLLQQIDWGWDNNEKIVVEAAELLINARMRDTSSEFYSGLGVLSSVRNDVSGAIRAHRRAVQLAPNEPDPHYRLGVQLAQMAQTEEAAKEFRRAIELKPDFVDAYRWQARLAAFTGKPNDAAKHIATAMDLSPNLARVRVSAGLHHFNRGEFSEAAKHLQQAMTLRPKLYRQKGIAGTIALFQGKGQEATSLLKDAADKTEDWRDALRLYQTYLLTGKSSQAEKALKEALSEAGKELAAHPGDLETELGQLYIRCLLGEVKDADQDFKRLATNTQKTLDPTIRFYYTAAVDAHLGMTDRAVDYVERILKMNVYAPAYIAADPMFAKLKNDTRFQKLVGAPPSS